MQIDIHTHNFPPRSKYAVCNLSLKQAQEHISTDSDIVFSVGFHPWYLGDFSPQQLYLFEKIVSNCRCVAIGECGLDKNVDTPLNVQIKIFEEQIIVSEQMEKPLIIHCVGRFNELLEVRKRICPKQMWIIHGFRGKPQLAQQLLAAGCSLSYGEKFNAESVVVTPIERLFVETDESKLPIEAIAGRIAELKQCRIDDLNAGEKWWKLTER